MKKNIIYLQNDLAFWNTWICDLKSTKKWVDSFQVEKLKWQRLNEGEVDDPDDGGEDDPDDREH